jgi:hypothetical protein
MTPKYRFDEILQAIDQLPVEQQSDLIEVVRRRLVARGREQVLADVKEARSEFLVGQAKPSTVDDLMSEIAR